MNFNMFKKKPKVEFYSLIPEVVDIMPIEPAGKVKPAWMLQALEHYGELRKNPSYFKNKNIHVSRCPGIFHLYNMGWIMRTWQDVVIKTNGDGHSFQWRCPINQKGMNADAGDYIGYHTPEQLSNYTGDYPHSLTTIIKFHNPWRCIVPKGYYLWEGPVPYSDEKRFTVLPGVHDSTYGVSHMNIQILWHCLESEELIPAGTPLAYYFLIPKEKFDFECKPADKDFMHKHSVSLLGKESMFHPNIKKFKDMIKREFK